MNGDLTPTQKQALAHFGLNELPPTLARLDQQILKTAKTYPADWGWVEVGAYQALLDALGHQPWWRQTLFP